jgi:hypothetical protein
MKNIKTLSDLKKNITNLMFEQVYNSINRQDPESIPEKVRGKRPVISANTQGAYIALAAGHESAAPGGAFWQYPKAKNVTLTPVGDRLYLVVTHDDSDWVIKYFITAKE